MKPETCPPSAFDATQILRARARVLARPRKQAPATETLLELLEFRLARERYAVEVRYVREVYPLKDLTPLPSTPPFVLGVVNVRGRILPVLDSARKFLSICPSKAPLPICTESSWCAATISNSACSRM